MQPEDLWLLSPGEFVAARNALVRALRKDGDRALAAEVATWRRPTPTDWALNHTSREQPEVVQRFVDRARSAAEAQSAAAQGGQRDLRSAIGELRASTDDLVGAAVEMAETGETGGSGHGVTAASVATRVRTVAANPALLAELEAGHLGQGDPGIADPFAVPAETEPTRPPRQSASRREREKALASLRRAAKAARSALETADRKVAAGQAAVDQARASLEAAEAALSTAGADRDAAQAAADRADVALAAASAAADQ